MQPNTVTAKIELSQLMTTSPSPNNIVETEAEEGTEENPVNFARRHSLWDED